MCMCKYYRLLAIIIPILTFNNIAYCETIDPATDIEYLGAFRLPTDTTGGNYSWEYGLQGMTFYPNGDASGPDDGTPGSLYALNHTYDQYVAEISIPVPVKSKNLSELNRAQTLQNFHDINKGTYSVDYIETEIAYLPKQGEQTTDKLYISWNDWYNVADEDVDRLGWCELDLSNPNTQGPWNLGSSAEVNPQTVGEYLFEIPDSWAASYTPGKLLITGKYRQGGNTDGGVRYGGGPSMYAFGPWNHGNPPAKETTLGQITLLSYIGGHVWECSSNSDNCSANDHWEGGAWITAGNKSAVVLTGTKGLGEDYYGSACDYKGYHSLGGYKPYMLFYDPQDLADVAAGEKEPYEPQPYATLDCGEYAINSWGECSGGYSSAAYDRENQLLYVAEPKVDGANAVIHVFRINSSTEDEKVLSSITISGATQLDEGGSATFTCTATYSDGSSATVAPTWNDDSDYASIDSSGVLTAASVDADQTVTITASYNGKTATYSLTINDVPGSVVELSSIAISGATQLDEGESATFLCTANYNDGSSATVTPTWDDNSDYASIDSSGVLTATSVDADQTVTITASYNGETATYSVTINDLTETSSGNNSSGNDASDYGASTAAELLSAVTQANSAGGNATIYLQDGTYDLSDTLYITAPGVTIAGQSGDRTKVIIQGDSMASNASVQSIFNVFASDFEVRNVTMQRCGTHIIQIHGENNADNPTIVNCVFRDSYEQMLKVSADSNDTSVASDNGLVEDCLFEYSAGVGPQYYIGGVDAHASNNWTIRGNTFRNIISPSGSVAEYAVHFWNQSANNIVENNTIINCDRGIGFGMDGKGNSAGIIRNNMIYHGNDSGAYADVAIALTESPNSQVYNNTIYMENSFPWAIEYRFTSTSGVLIANNLTNKPIIQRDSATGTVANNNVDASESWFANVSTGNLHLATAVSSVVDVGQIISGLSNDIDGDTRPQGSGIDIGADEIIASGQETTITAPKGVTIVN